MVFDIDALLMDEQPFILAEQPPLREMPSTGGGVLSGKGVI